MKRRCGTVLLALLFCCLFAGPVLAAQPSSQTRVVRVAYPEQKGLTAVDEDGKLYGYTYEYLEEIAQYTGIYLGGGRFIACSNEEKPVIVQDMTLKYFTDHYVTARRF